jgi:hypothetical protein
MVFDRWANEGMVLAKSVDGLAVFHKSMARRNILSKLPIAYSSPRYIGQFVEKSQNPCPSEEVDLDNHQVLGKGRNSFSEKARVTFLV